jgi:hypothetical protein
MNLDEIWTSLEADLASGHAAQRFARRIHADSTRDIRVAVDGHTGARMLLVRVQSAALDSSMEFPASRGFELRHVPLSEDGPRQVTLGVILTRPDHADVFTSLVSDVSRRVAATTSDQEAVSELIARLQRWQSFLHRHRPDGLSDEGRRGLYGELWFLRQFVLPASGPAGTVRSWVGPRSANQDFQLPRCAIEVKTSAANPHQFLHIASERQLDDTGAGTLLLFHLSVDEREGGGETLVEIVTAVRGLVIADMVAIEEFEASLIDAGYLDSQARQYLRTGYTIRRQGFFRVNGEFPRIVERDLRSGVGNVRYSIAVSTCDPFTISDEEAAQVMRMSHEE